MKEILIPFMAHEHPLLYGMGTLGLYGMRYPAIDQLLRMKQASRGKLLRDTVRLDLDAVPHIR